MATSEKKRLLKYLVGPSVLASDLSRLAFEAEKVCSAGADYLHLDIMDGHFVPNITIGPPVIKSLRMNSKAFFDCHLMVTQPEKWVTSMAQAGADQFTFHLEASTDPTNLIKNIKENGMKVGIAIKPKTDVVLIEPYVDMIDLVLIMTVEPGFGGQSFQFEMLEKVRYLRAKYKNLNIQVDGGIGINTIEEVAIAGANWIVSGSSVFQAEDPKVPIQNMKSVLEKHSMNSILK